MVYQQGLISLDTSKMVAYETGMTMMPRIYQSHCGGHVLLALYDVQLGTRLHYASPSEVEFYARKFALPQLLRAYPQEGTSQI